MNDLMEYAIALGLLVVMAYVGANAIALATGVAYITLPKSIAIVIAFICMAVFARVFKIAMEGNSKEEEQLANAKNLLISAVLSNEGTLNVQNYIYEKVARDKKEYVFKVEEIGGITKITIKE